MSNETECKETMNNRDKFIAGLEKEVVELRAKLKKIEEVDCSISPVLTDYNFAEKVEIIATGEMAVWVEPGDYKRNKPHGVILNNGVRLYLGENQIREFWEEKQQEKKT